MKQGVKAVLGLVLLFGVASTSNSSWAADPSFKFDDFYKSTHEKITSMAVAGSPAPGVVASTWDEIWAKHDEVMKVCVANAEKKHAAIADAKASEDKATFAGMTFSAAGIISTYHPVSLGLETIGTLLFSANKSVANVFSTNVAEATGNYNQYQKSIGDANVTFYTDYDAAKRAADLNAQLEALRKLSDACNSIGLQMPPTN